MRKTEYVIKILGHGYGVDVANDNVDVLVYFDGSKYAATFFTLENIRHLFLKNRTTGECAAGTYLWAASMIIVESLDEETIRAAVADLMASGEFDRAFEGPYPID